MIWSALGLFMAAKGYAMMSAFIRNRRDTLEQTTLISSYFLCACLLFTLDGHEYRLLFLLLLATSAATQLLTSLCLAEALVVSRKESAFA
jgi:hypothetical protein